MVSQHSSMRYSHDDSFDNDRFPKRMGPFFFLFTILPGNRPPHGSGGPKFEWGTFGKYYK
jgi:hypothetical protein